MNEFITRCATEMYQQKYIEFLLEHYKRLKLPYSFSASLSFLSSPIMLKDGEAFLAFNGEYEVIGALGYICGTSEHQFEDREIIQFQSVYIKEEYRNPRLFLLGLQYVTQYIAQLKQEVKEVRFWAPADEGLRRLFDKITDSRASHETAFGGLDEYRASFSVWQAYASQFRHEVYFDC